MISKHLWNYFLKLQLSIFYLTKIILLNRVFCIYGNQYTTHFSVHPVPWKIMYELCQNNAPLKLWKFNIYLLNFLVYYLTGYLFHLFDFEYRYTNGKLVYINTTAHKLITMGNHFCTSRIKEKKNSYMFQTKYLN